MDDTVKWLLALVALLVVVLLVAFARGQEHHRGNETGASAAVTART
jgi:hypothetical protein